MSRWLVWVPHILWAGVFIYLYNERGATKLNYDTMSASMSTLQLIIVVGGILGFGYFAHLSEKRAADVAKQVAKDEAVPEARRAAQEWLEQFGPRETGEGEEFKEAFNDGAPKRKPRGKQDG